MTDPHWEHPPREREKELFTLWQGSNPRLAFAAGLHEWAGRLFRPTARARSKRAMRIERMLPEAEHPALAGALRSLHATLVFEEPPIYPENLVWAFYAHVLHEGTQERHLRNLCAEAVQVLKIARGHLTEEPWPIEIRALTASATESLADLLAALKRHPKAASLSAEFDAVIAAARSYGESFAAPGVRIGSFEEVFPLLEREGGSLERSGAYPMLLSDLHGHPERPAAIEAYGRELLAAEVKALQRATNELAPDLDCEATPGSVKAALAARGPQGTRLLACTLALREHLHPIVAATLVAVTPNYDTRVIETPDYLVSLYPTAGMNSFDHFTGHPYNIYYLTTAAHAPPGGLAEIYQTLLHEEHGHCVNFSNSHARFGPYRPSLAERLITPLEGPVTEGISFQREVEAYELILRILHGAADLPAPLRRHARQVVPTLERHGQLVDLESENRFEMHLWRALRALRAIGDVRLNTGAQSVVDFCHWGAAESGLPVKTVFDQVFTFQNWPGYAPCYALGARPIAEAHRRLANDPAERYAFNTFLSGMGFPPRGLFEARIRAWLDGDRPAA